MKYTPTEILSVRFRQAVQLRKLSRAELFTRMQLIRTVEPLVDEAFKISEQKILEQQLDNGPHGQPWHISFHASQFPGDDPMACSRQSLYRMMDFPQMEPTPRRLRLTAEAGKAIESSLVAAWYNAGMLLSSPDPNDQTNFMLSEAWLTGSVDAVISVPSSGQYGVKPMPVEIKNRSASTIEAMKLGQGPFPEHVSQIKTQLGFIHLYQEADILHFVKGNFPQELDLVTHGIIYYVSRDNPLETAEFRVDLDVAFFDVGANKLKRWISYFEEDVLPENNPGKRSTQFGHPHGWRWSYPPCAYCPFKKTCQLDFREEITQLSKSIGIDRAKTIRPNYDPEVARLRVKEHWQNINQKERV